MSCLTLNCRRSQIFIRPSSPPDAMNGSFLFQWMTLMSRSWASLAVIIQALEGAARASHTRIVLSTEQEANTWSIDSHRSSSISDKFVQKNQKLLFKQWSLYNVEFCFISGEILILSLNFSGLWGWKLGICLCI